MKSSDAAATRRESQADSDTASSLRCAILGWYRSKRPWRVPKYTHHYSRQNMGEGPPSTPDPVQSSCLAIYALASLWIGRKQGNALDIELIGIGRKATGHAAFYLEFGIGTNTRTSKRGV
mmetsp:Transcript_34126/g.82524  ORF Transcript_34126/g.82524 Transcript_34126/m.82524 type:complete len:120 (-) Transcript_34126:40-399(-)